MSFRIEDPIWLWLLAAAIPLTAVALYAFTAMARLRRWSAIVARVALVGLLAAALAGASSIRRVDKAALVVAVDTSGSVRAFVPDVNVGPLKAGGDLIAPVLKGIPELLGRAEQKEVQSLGPDDTVTLFTFDSAPHVLTATGPVQGRSTLSRDYTPSPVEGSDIASAIKAAAAALPPDSTGRILLISDGLAQPTVSGGASASGRTGSTTETPAAAALSAARAAFTATKVPIDVLPLKFENPREVIVESLDAPTRVASDRAPVPLTLTVTSIADAPVTGTLRLLQEGQEVALPKEAATLTLQPGRNILTLRVPLSPGRLHRFEAIFEPSLAAAGVRPSDTVAANNRAVAFTTSPGGGRILVVDGTGLSPPASTPLVATLTQAGLSTTLITPNALDNASDLLSLQAYDLVILVDVPADALSLASQQNLARYTADTGGGLLMVGGPPPTANSFGAGGWKGTPIEPLLPVTLDLPDRLVMPSTAVVIILDSSGSMAHSVMGSSASQQEIANRGAAAALGALDKQDLVGVIEFNSTSSWVVPLRPNNQPKETAEKILGINPNGGTNLPPALQMAYDALQPVRAAVKHIIVLSDGQSQGRGRLAALAKKCKEAPGGPIKISSIAVGDDADTDGLERLARNAGGEYFHVIDPNILPRIFVKAVRVVRTPLIREEPFTPVLGPGGAGSPATAGITGGGFPQLGGLILTQPRLDAQKKNVEGVTYALLTPQGEPLLAHWRVGLGQVGVFTSSPLGGGWAKAWDTVQTRSLWTQLARALSRSGGGTPGDAQPDLAARLDGDALRIRIDVPPSNAAAGNTAAAVPKVSVYSPSGARTELTPTLTAPGVYEAAAPAVEGEGVYVVTVAPTTSGAAPVIGGIVKASAAAAEYRVPSTSAAGTELLTQIARETGGRVLSLEDLKTMTAPQLFAREKVEPRESRTPLWPILVMVACGVLLADIATRRIAWDRWGDGDGSPDASGDGNRKSGSAVRRTASTSPAAAPRPESDSPLAAAKRRARRETDGA